MVRNTRKVVRNVRKTVARNTRTVRAAPKAARTSRKVALASLDDVRRGTKFETLVKLLRKGATVDTIADKIDMTPGTVRSYFPFILEKYGVTVQRDDTTRPSQYYI